jgi:hypothetical protein
MQHRVATDIKGGAFTRDFPATYPGVSPGAAPRPLPKTMHVEFLISPEGSSEELRLWADYYEATARVLEIMRTQGTTTAAVAQIVAEEAKAAGAIKRIKEIRGIKG